MSTYTAKVSWARKPEERFTDGKYSRAHQWAFDGGAVVPASSSPHEVRVPFSDPAGVDPEEALLAALSSCHMLFFLDFAKHKGYVVERYVDDPVGLVGKIADGRVQMTLVTLKPHIVFTGDKRPTEVDVESLHHHAHEHCYIANTVKSEIVIDGICEGLMPT